LHRLEEKARVARLDALELERGKKMKEENPEMFVTYPDQPRRRYIPVPELMH